MVHGYFTKYFEFISERLELLDFIQRSIILIKPSYLSYISNHSSYNHSILDSILLVDNPLFTDGFLYLQSMHEFRKDIDVINIELARKSWFPNIHKKYRAVNFPSGLFSNISDIDR